MYTLDKPTFLRAFDDFLYKPAYLLLCWALTVFANVFGAELFTYTCFVLIFLYLCLLGRDLLPMMPLAVCAYIAPSRNSNPGLRNDSLFAFSNGGLYILILAAILVAALVYRLIRDPELGRSAFFKCKRTLLPGMLALAAGYLLSGLGSQQLATIGTKNLLFSLLQGASILLFYVVLTGGVMG